MKKSIVQILFLITVMDTHRMSGLRIARNLIVGIQLFRSTNRELSIGNL